MRYGAFKHSTINISNPFKTHQSNPLKTIEHQNNLILIMIECRYFMVFDRSTIMVLTISSVNDVNGE